jgi:tripartite-type tricarboxylate transporter receptor subunit TctC
MVSAIKFIIGLLLCWNVAALAQTAYPEKAITIIVGFAPGSQPDTVARLLSQKLFETWGRPVVVENAAGASGNIGAERVSKAAPDGYTLGLLGQTQLVINPNLYKLAYDPLRDFALISQLTLSPTILVVSNNVPAKSVKELVGLAKARPGELTFASAGTGSGPHLPAEFFKSRAGIDLVHVPYKGGSAAIPDLVSGRVTMMFGTTSLLLPLTREGKLRPLAVTSKKRTPAAPEIPTFAESGFPDFDYSIWHALVAPARTPEAVVRKIHGDTVKALSAPDVSAKLQGLGLDAIGNSPEEFAAAIKSEIPKWTQVIKASGMKVD